MKHLFVALTLLASLFTGSSFANDVRVSDAALESFNHQFSKAQNASWTEVDGMFRVAFTENNQQNFAYYNFNGELIVKTKQILFSELPVALQQNYQAKFSSYHVADVYEFKSEEKTEYYLVVENATKQLTLNATSKKWMSFKVVYKK